MALVAEIVTTRPNVSDTRTYKDFSTVLGENPKRLGIVASMYKNLTATYLTEGLGNIIYNQEGGKRNQYQPINSMCFEWQVEVSYLRRLPILAIQCIGNEYRIAFREHYYDKYDTFQICSTKQEVICLTAPVRKADNYWEYVCQLVDNTGEDRLDVTTLKEAETRFLRVIMPELHEEGYVKAQSNVEMHRNWISEIRHDQTWSARYARMEDVFVKVAQGEGTSYKEVYFPLSPVKHDLIQQFMGSRNNAMIIGKSTMDKNGKCRVQDPHTGRDLISGDGIIPQVEHFANFFSYNKLSVSILNRVLSTMIFKAQKRQGNIFTVVCNTRLYTDLQEVLAKQLTAWKPTDAKVYSEKDGKITVGAEFAGYTAMGNTINFVIDEVLDIEYNDRGYGICLDLSADKVSGKPAISMFTLDGKEYIESTFPGVENTSCAA